MRILLASDHYPPFIGGGHRWAAVIAAGLAERGHQVDVAAPWSGGQAMREQTGKVTLHRIRQMRTARASMVKDEVQRHQPPFPDPISIRDLRAVIAESTPDVVMVHGWIGASVAAALSSSTIPLLLTAHDYGYFCSTRMMLHHGQVCSGPAPAKCVACGSEFYGRPKSLATVAGVAGSKRVLRGRMNGLQAVSDYVADLHQEFLLDGAPRDAEIKRFTIPPPILLDPPGQGVDDATVAEYMAKLPDEPYILFVGAFRRFKGVEVLFEAYERLVNAPPLVMLGTYEHDSPTQFPDRAVVVTSVPHRAVMAAWDRCMFGVLPSLGPEPLGMVVVEGQSRGKPVIGSEPGGTTDALKDGAGMLVPKGDVTALAEAMQRLIDDPALREQIGAAARTRAERFSPERVLAETEAALQELIDAA